MLWLTSAQRVHIDHLRKDDIKLQSTDIKLQSNCDLVQDSPAAKHCRIPSYQVICKLDNLSALSVHKDTLSTVSAERKVG